MQKLMEPGRSRVVDKNTIVGRVVDEASGMAARNTFWPSEIVFVFVFVFVSVCKDKKSLMVTCYIPVNPSTCVLHRRAKGQPTMMDFIQCSIFPTLCHHFLKHIYLNFLLSFANFLIRCIFHSCSRLYFPTQSSHDGRLLSWSYFPERGSLCVAIFFDQEYFLVTLR